MRVIRWFCLVGVVALAGGVGDLAAQGRGRGDSSSAESSSSVNASVSVVFGDGELRAVRAWFGDSNNLRGLPPGLANRDSLPPGIQRQLQKNGTLPPGLQQHIHAVPDNLNQRLPTLISGISRFIIGGNILLVNDSTKVILDIAAIF